MTDPMLEALADLAELPVPEREWAAAARRRAARRRRRQAVLGVAAAAALACAGVLAVPALRDGSEPVVVLGPGPGAEPVPPSVVVWSDAAGKTTVRADEAAAETGEGGNACFTGPAYYTPAYLGGGPGEPAYKNPEKPGQGPCLPAPIHPATSLGVLNEWNAGWDGGRSTRPSLVLSGAVGTEVAEVEWREPDSGWSGTFPVVGTELGLGAGFYGGQLDLGPGDVTVVFTGVTVDGQRLPPVTRRFELRPDPERSLANPREIRFGPRWVIQVGMQPPGAFGQAMTDQPCVDYEVTNCWLPPTSPTGFSPTGEEVVTMGGDVSTTQQMFGFVGTEVRRVTLTYQQTKDTAQTKDTVLAPVPGCACQVFGLELSGTGQGPLNGGYILRAFDATGRETGRRGEMRAVEPVPRHPVRVLLDALGPDFELAHDDLVQPKAGSETARRLPGGYYPSVAIGAVRPDDETEIQRACAANTEGDFRTEACTPLVTEGGLTVQVQWESRSAEDAMRQRRGYTLRVFYVRPDGDVVGVEANVWEEEATSTAKRLSKAHRWLEELRPRLVAAVTDPNA